MADRPYMPGYGLRGPTEGTGLLPWSWAEERLMASKNFWLATHRPDGRPHIMPVWATWHDMALVFSSSKASRKARNLAHDPRCSLTTEDAYNPVVVEGTVELLLEPADLQMVIDVTNAKYSTSYSVDFLDPAVNCAYRLRPEWAFGLKHDDFAGSPTRWTFK